MAIDLTLKSNIITNREATPPVLNNPGAGGAGIVRTAGGFLSSVTAALSATSVIRFCEVPSNAIITRVWFASAAQGGGAMDLGLHRNNKDGGAVVDADYFATAIAVTSAVVITDETNESTTNTIAKRAQPIWQAAGMTADPVAMLDVTATISTDITTGTGAVEVRIEYVV